ncbi:holo-ACP synthase [Lactobacillus colini]|uniref:citrate lyase holo-[acyl-carrier protein] synthase n=1 Tax=Lactobacillus colini TaxID=1819254 RepID=A0ABS4MDC4_9LACO|nr:citrate lyase holo-[acyl-carrier protein] synthase [Lactobacillus colini]MBP2057684.1 holo-ACP synthase [Lactobacillus colini]
MNKTIFNEGQKQDISAILAAKDYRVQLQKAIFAKYPGATIVNVNLNIPGPIKNNHYLEQIFSRGKRHLEELFLENDFDFRLVKEINQPSGQEIFYVVGGEPRLIKEACIVFEDQTELGRLFDADVIVEDQVKAVSRKDLGQKQRTCFICSRPAKECARSRRHSVTQMQEYISRLYFENFNEKG